MADRNKIIDQFFGDASTPIEWASDEEKKLHFWLDDLHCPQPISPMWFDIGGWWLTCGYMYRRFGVPFGKDWVAKTVSGYLMSAVVPREAEEEAGLWVVLQHGDARLRRQVPRLVEAPLPARNPSQLRIPRHIPDGIVFAARDDDPARRSHRHPGAPLAAALDAQPRAVSGVDYVRERSHSHRRRPAQAACRPHSHLGRRPQLGLGARTVDVERDGEEEPDAEARLRRERDGGRCHARAERF